MDELRQYLRMNSELMKRTYPESDLTYDGTSDFVLQHGSEMEAAPWSERFRKGQAKQCYSNSLTLSAQTGYRYVEGYVVPEGISMPVLHAWNLNEDGRVIDVTLRTNGLAYLGVVFSAGRMDDAVQNGTGCILEDWMRSYPILDGAWNGETARVWPESRDFKLRKHIRPYMRD